MHSKCIIFDFDGVVIDSCPVQKLAFYESFALSGGQGEPDFATFLQHGGDSLENIIRKMTLPTEMISHYRRLSREKLQMIDLMPGMHQLLSELQQRNVPMALCTGKDRLRTLEILDHLEIRHFFSAIVCSDDVAKPKPDPESVVRVLNLLEFEPADALMVGDSLNDLLAASAAGVKSVLMTWGPYPQEAPTSEICNNCAELKECIDQFLVKRDWLINDLVVLENNCNQQCEYCLTDTSQFKDSHREHLIREKPRIYEYALGTDLQQRLDQLLARMQGHFDFRILKVSGGEIFLVKGIMELIRRETKKVAVLQMLTNGLAVTEKDLDEIKALGNVCMQLSIDHHTLEGNYYRLKSARLQEKVLQNIEKIIARGIPLEINCVLTDRNTAIIGSFAEYLARYDRGVKLFPFPVRGQAAHRFWPGPAELKGIEELLANYSRWQAILPPRVYLEELLNFLQTGRRGIGCSLPLLAVGSFDDGTITPCPNMWLADFGNLLQENALEVVEQIGRDKIYSVLVSKQAKLPVCKGCFTPWEMLNLFMEDRLSIEELMETPLYSSPEVAAALQQFKTNRRLQGKKVEI